MIEKKCWLLKSEPSSYSIDDLNKDGETFWDGVRNYQARNFLKGMKIGDRILFYHSNAKPSAVVGIAKIIKEAFPDETQFDKNSIYFDLRATKATPVWFSVGVSFIKKFKRVVPLGEIRSNPNLQGIGIAQKGSRLSVLPILSAHFEEIVREGNTKN